MNNIELLSPAGSPDAFKAAIDAGSTAVYFGVERFNARVRAENITLDELKTLIPLAKSKGVKTYLTINILFLDSEIPALVELVSESMDYGIDAVIVQDIGVAYVLHALFPQLELHGSTQLTTHNTAQCDFLSQLSFSQVNLSRELSLSEIEIISKKLGSLHMKSEVFVHGAYCISYSGQCYFSNGLYGEAGNRGQCVQPCRRTYSAVGGGKLWKGTPFNLKDNCAYSLIKDLVKAASFSKGVSLKIEGRIKSKEYVWAVTSAWKKQVQRLEKGLEPEENSELLSGSFNRSFSDGYLRSEISRDMFTSGEKDHSVTPVGNVTSFYADKKILTLKLLSGETLVKGDKVSIQTADGRFICTGEIGETVKSMANHAASMRGTVSYNFVITNKLTGKIEEGQLVKKYPQVVDTEKVEERIGKLQVPATGLLVKVSGKADEKMKVTFTTVTDILYGESTSVTVESEQKISEAQNKALNKAVLEDKLCSFGGTGFVLAELDSSELADGLFLPVSVLKNLRRDGISQLLEHKKEKSKIQKVPLSLEELTGKTPVTRIGQKKVVFLCSSIQKAAACFEITKQNWDIPLQVAFEVPLGKASDDQIKQFLVSHSSIIPYFSAVLFEQDLEDAKNLLLHLPKGRVWTENAGLAYWCSTQGYSVILGSHINISNSFALNVSEKVFGKKTAVVPSIEISPDTIVNLAIPDSMELWYPLYSDELLMQSRQCLVKNIPDEQGNLCEKRITDRFCVENCNRKVHFEGSKKESLQGIKRPGFYSGIYREEKVSNKAFFRALENKVGVWTVDLRFDSGLALETKIEGVVDLVQGRTVIEPFTNCIQKNYFIEPWENSCDIMDNG